jgi:uncharacterized protein (DUF302 family)
MTIDWLMLLIGIIVGMLVMGVIVWLMMPSMMLIKHKTMDGYDEVLKKLNDNMLLKQDWKILKTNDYQESTASFNALERVCSVNVCNPRYASEILMDDHNRSVTAFMPLAIGVYEDKQGQVYISQLNVGLLGMMFGGTIAKVMKIAGRDITDSIKPLIIK